MRISKRWSGATRDVINTSSKAVPAPKPDRFVSQHGKMITSLPNVETAVAIEAIVRCMAAFLPMLYLRVVVAGNRCAEVIQL